MRADDTAIRIKHVSHRFGEEGEARNVRALLDTSFDIARGELLCLIGPSGCGKSTLLNVMGGLLTPTAGTVEVFGKPVTGPLPQDIACRSRAPLWSESTSLETWTVPVHVLVSLRPR